MLETLNLLDQGQLPLVCAYIDPGSGSILLQLLIAGVLGAVFYFRNIFRRYIGAIKNFLKRKSGDE